MGSHARRRANTASPGAIARWTSVGAAAFAACALVVGVAAGAPGNPAETQLAPDAVAGTPCSVTADACVELATHRAWLLDDGKIVRGPVAVQDGASDEPTPRGTFNVEWKADRWVSREFGTPMPWAVFFAPGGISFHEGQQDTPSAGCVKLENGDAHAFFDFLKVGDEVQVR